MIYGLYESAGGMLVNEHRQAVLANNLANADTVGFRRDVATFVERRIAADAGRRSGPRHELLDALGGGVWLGATHTDFSEGNLKTTGQPYDAALAGPGFFQVRAADGQTYLTRDGRFIRDQRGQLRAAIDGAEVLGAGGAPLFLNPRGSDPVIDERGRILQNNITVGQLAVSDVADPSQLQKVGATRFRPLAGAQPIPATGHVIQRTLEDSGVAPVVEMTQMLEAARAYQFNARMVSLQDESLGRLINSVAA